jgi:hypothetical protein
MGRSFHQMIALNLVVSPARRSEGPLLKCWLRRADQLLHQDGPRTGAMEGGHGPGGPASIDSGAGAGGDGGPLGILLVLGLCTRRAGRGSVRVSRQPVGRRVGHSTDQLLVTRYGRGPSQCRVVVTGTKARIGDYSHSQRGCGATAEAARRSRRGAQTLRSVRAWPGCALRRAMAWHVAFGKRLAALLIKRAVRAAHHRPGPFRAARVEVLRQLALEETTFGRAVEMIVKRASQTSGWWKCR